MNPAAENLNWLVGRFVQQVVAVRQAVVVSSDGLPLAFSKGVDRESAERLAAGHGHVGLVGRRLGGEGWILDLEDLLTLGAPDFLRGPALEACLVILVFRVTLGALDDQDAPLVVAPGCSDDSKPRKKVSI